MPSAIPPTRQELLSGGVRLVGDPDVSALADRFTAFQALTHGFVIDNPMGSDTLDRVIEALDPHDGDRVIDIPCGRGELLIRLGERANTELVGVDISPWVIRDAMGRARGRSSDLRLHLGDGKAFPREPTWDIACSIGGSWIWNGTLGTVKALGELCRPGGRIAFGDVLLRPGVSTDDLPRTGRPMTRDDVHAAFGEAGLTSRLELVSTPSEWESYARQTVTFARAFPEIDPARRTSHIAFAEEGLVEFEHDREFFDWVVFVAERT